MGKLFHFCEQFTREYLEEDHVPEFLKEYK